MNPATDIREHMEVVGSDGNLIGIVDHLEGADRIKLTKNDSADGQHHFISTSLVERVDDVIHLSKPADDVMSDWDSDDDIEIDDGGTLFGDDVAENVRTMDSSLDPKRR